MPILQVRARDDDGSQRHNQIIYSFEQGPSTLGNPFHIDPATGWISLQSPLDYESRQRYELTLIATDASRMPAVHLLSFILFYPVLIHIIAIPLLKAIFYLYID